MAAGLSSGGAFDQPQDQQQDHCADQRIDDGSDKAAADDDADPRQQPAGNQAADDADDDVADQPKAAAFDEQSRQPAMAPTISQMIRLTITISSLSSPGPAQYGL